MMTPGMRLRSTAAIMAMSFGGMAMDPFSRRSKVEVRSQNCIHCGTLHFHPGGYCSAACCAAHVPTNKATHNPPSKKKSRSKRKK